MAEGKAPKQINPKSMDDYLEVMCKTVFQSGMSWKVIESKWPDIREAFHDFNIAKVAALDDSDLDRLVEDRRVVRNYRKLAAIVANAKRMAELAKQPAEFQAYLRSHGDFDATLKAMKKDFKFMGPMACFYFLYAVGERVPPHEEFQAQYRR